MGWLSLACVLILVWFLIYTQRFPSGDEGVYVPAGRQLIAGQSPGSVNPEHPPLAKYAIGLSQLVIGNPRAVGGFLVSTAISALYYLLRRVEGLRFAAATMVLLAVNPLFTMAMSIATLEVYWISFVVLGLFAILAFKLSGFSYTVCGLFFGCAVASKLTAVPFALAIVVYIATRGRKRGRVLKHLLMFFAPMILVYLTSYWTVVIDLGFSGFVRYQLSVINFHEAGLGSDFIPSPAYRIFEAPAMAFLGFTNYLYLANYVPHLFLFGTYWRPTAYVNPALWILAIPSFALGVYRCRKSKSEQDILWVLLFVAGLSVTWLSPKFFLFYFDGLSIPMAVLIAKSLPSKILLAYLCFATLTPILLYLPSVGLLSTYQLIRIFVVSNLGI